MSSEICGELDADYANYLGSILLKLLPAGSVSGAPKPKTLEIIKAVEEKFVDIIRVCLAILMVMI